MTDERAHEYLLGDYRVQCENGRLFIWSGERCILKGPKQGPFLKAVKHQANITDSRGHFHIQSTARSVTDSMDILSIEQTPNRISIDLRLYTAQESLAARIHFAEVDGRLAWHAHFVKRDIEWDVIQFLWAQRDSQFVVGFGEQLTHLNMQGRKVPILSQEPGIGRGVQPLTTFMNVFFKAGGSWSNSNAPSSFWVNEFCVGMALRNTEYHVYNFEDSEVAFVECWTPNVHGWLFVGQNPKEVISSFTKYAGRMPVPPDWVNNGAIIGIQGGSEKLRSLNETYSNAGIEIAAYWAQDWVGSRKTAIGKQLWWSWTVDRESYPDWEALVAELDHQNIKMLSYLNPFLVELPKADRRNLYQEALDNHYFVKQPDGQVYQIQNTSFSASMLDLSHPGCRTWIKEVIKEELIASGVSGWMADFGEALPFDALLHDGDAVSYHNRYPVEWIKLNREAITEAGKADEILVFNRAGYTKSLRYSTMFWMGDQLTSWSSKDGIKSALTGLLSSGISGLSLNHGDIGGYIATSLPYLSIGLPFFTYRRSKEQLLRWIEMFAFTALFRTHEGNQPDLNVQINHDEELLNHFALFSRLFKLLTPYRKHLYEEATSKGLPVVRHPWIVDPSESRHRELRWQFFMGDDVLVAPMLWPQRKTRHFYLSPGEWEHCWTGETMISEGIEIQGHCPIGEPIVYFRKNSSFLNLFRQIKSLCA